jgi:Zn-dependent protease
MGSSLKIATVFGIEVRIHVTFLLFLAWIWITYYQVGGLSGAIQGVLFILALFTCVLLHEFGHAFAAREFGIKTPDITLLPIGGVARLSRIPDKPWQELVVAIAGPLVNVVIAVALYFVVQGTTEFLQIDRLENPRIQVLDMLYTINKWLVGFNMIPAFPMDGGRVLRALLAMAMPYRRATQIAARIGQGLAVLFAFVGVLSYQGFTFFGVRGSPFLIFIAFFIFVGAQQELIMSKAHRSSQRE